MLRAKSVRALWNPISTSEPIDVLIMPGTWNPDGDGISAAFADALNQKRFRPRVVSYPADYGRTMPYAESLAAGRRALIAAIDASPGRLVLAGYSQGAAIAGDVAASLGRDELARVVACALIADPLRPMGKCLGADPGGYGIAGQRDVPNIPTYWAAAPGDPITALPAGNPLRSIADLSAYFSLSSPQAALRWGQSLLDAATRRQLQRWWSPQNWRSWSGAVAYARGYLIDGRHTEDYIRHGHAARLAERINTEIGLRGRV